MPRLLLALSLALSIFAVGDTPASASGCALCLASVSLQTRDGQPWSAGKPVTLVVEVQHAAQTAAPPTGLAVVMQTDGDRTKCLDVPLKLVRSDDTSATYAGLFFPFYAARFDGKLSIGDMVEDITFDVRQMSGGAAPSGQLPEAEKIDTSAPAVTLFAPSQLPLAAAGALAFWALVALALRLRRRPARQVA